MKNKRMCFDCAIILIYYTILYTLSLQYLLSIINTFMHSIIDEQSQTDYSDVYTVLHKLIMHAVLPDFLVLFILCYLCTKASFHT